MVGAWKFNSDKIFDVINTVILGVLLAVLLYPLYFILIASVSDYNAVNTGKVVFAPVNFTLDCYLKVFKEGRIWSGYRNSLLYTLAGTSLNVTITILAGYALSRKDLVGRKLIMGFFLVTMFFNGGLIPLFIQVRKMGLYNHPLVLILLGAVSVYNLIITRTYFEESLPDDMREAAFIDGCGNARFFRYVVLPLSKPIIAIMVLYYAVGHWNGFFNALIYISDYKYQPLQIVLRDILLANQVQNMMDDVQGAMERMRYAEQLKYGVVVVASLPMLIMYPFVQRYFVKGLMIGAVKG